MDRTARRDRTRNTSLRDIPHVMEPRRVLTRGGSVLKPLSSVKDHHESVRITSRLLGEARARSRYSSLSRVPVCPRVRRRVHLCFSLSIPYDLRLHLLLSPHPHARRASREQIAMISRRGLMSRHNRGSGTQRGTQRLSEDRQAERMGIRTVNLLENAEKIGSSKVYNINGKFSRTCFQFKVDRQDSRSYFRITVPAHQAR